MTISSSGDPAATDAKPAPKPAPAAATEAKIPVDETAQEEASEVREESGGYD